MPTVPSPKPLPEDKGIVPNAEESQRELTMIATLRSEFPQLDADARVRVLEYLARLHSDTAKKAQR